MIMILANIVIALMVLVVLPIWILARIKFPLWAKLSMGFNYLALLVIVWMQLGAMVSLSKARLAANWNLGILTRALTELPATRTIPALESWLANDERGFFNLTEALPELKPAEKSVEKAQ